MLASPVKLTVPFQTPFTKPPVVTGTPYSGSGVNVVPLESWPVDEPPVSLALPLPSVPSVVVGSGSLSGQPLRTRPISTAVAARAVRPSALRMAGNLLTPARQGDATLYLTHSASMGLLCSAHPEQI